MGREWVIGEGWGVRNGLFNLSWILVTLYQACQNIETEPRREALYTIGHFSKESTFSSSRNRGVIKNQELYPPKK